uniref:NADH-ubiquinone oxidoreductase chain 6 n=1 Tax=Opistoplatys sp. HL-2013 TaxID=1347747 RepID=A0A7I6HH32_9HEMI|nr:NADH dehydrogenase subunit 6 [Opistoplatys sp. HL-2013]
MIMTSLIFSILFPFMNHPLALGIILIIQTIIIAILTGSMINSYWYSYLLIMIMLSGALVLFIYMATIASNEKFKTPKMSFPLIIPLLLIMFPFIKNNQNKYIFYNNIYNTNSSLQAENLIKLFNIPNMMITMIMVIYLLATMIMVSFIINNNEGPLRKKN